MKTVHCKKLQKELPALDRAPYPGKLGERIYKDISAQAWEMWLQRQTMLINEYRLNLMDMQARQYLMQQMEQFLFHDADVTPPGFHPMSGQS